MMNRDVSTDRPIERQEQDELNRSGFAHAIAQGIKGRSGKESFVIALYGAWGSGKSSVKNMILELLRSDVTTCPTIVEFNPWQFTDASTLSQGFFSEIALALDQHVGTADDTQKDKERAAKWKQFAGAVNVGGDIITNVAKVAGVLGVPFMEVPKAIGDAMKQASVETKEASTLLEGAFTRSLSDIRKDLRALMAGLENPMLVVIDDIDRLTSSEMSMVFQLVKANGDFPNLVYLLLFQRDIVESSLKKVAPDDAGEDFLEKIVQLGLDLPAISQNQLVSLLHPDLENLLGAHVTDKLFMPPKTRTVGEMIDGNSGLFFLDVLLPYFETVRDVRRFINSLDFQIGMLVRDGVLEVNPEDLLAVEVLRVFEPTVYRGIATAKHVFTSNPGHLYGGGGNQRSYITGLLEKASSRGNASAILGRLFPNVNWVLIDAEVPSGIGPGDKDLGQLRVCHPDMFSRYFQLLVPSEGLTQREFHDLKAKIKNPDLTTEHIVARKAFADELIFLIDRGLLDEVALRLYYDEDTWSLPFFIGTAVCDVADQVALPISGRRQWLALLLSHALKRHDSYADADLMVSIMGAAEGLYLITNTIVLHVERMREKNENEFFPAKRLTELQMVWINRLRAVAQSDALRNNPKRDLIASGWLTLEQDPSNQSETTSTPASQWVRDHTNNKDDLLSLLRLFVLPSASEDIVQIDHDRVDDVSPIHSILFDQIRSLNRSTLNPADDALVGKLLEAMKITDKDAS